MRRSTQILLLIIAAAVGVTVTKAILWHDRQETANAPVKTLPHAVSTGAATVHTDGEWVALTYADAGMRMEVRRDWLDNFSITAYPDNVDHQRARVWMSDGINELTIDVMGKEHDNRGYWFADSADMFGDVQAQPFQYETTDAEMNETPHHGWLLRTPNGNFAYAEYGVIPAAIGEEGPERDAAIIAFEAALPAALATLTLE